jgi:hypothetical protein
MSELVGKYFLIIMLSALKFALGPIAAFKIQLNFFETVICTSTGMMLSVVVFSIIGHRVKIWQEHHFPRKKKLFTTKNRRIVAIWQKFGLTGIAILTPILLMPIGGTLLAAAFGEHSKRIILFMLPSAIAWAIVITVFVDDVAPYIKMLWGEIEAYI